MSGSRNAWIAARARNAARRGGWIAVIGGTSAIVTLLAFVMVPRELDRQLRRRIAALPAPPDSMPFARRLDSLRARQRDTLPALDSVLLNDVIVLPGDIPAPVRPPERPSAPVDSAARALRALLDRARSVPLPDSYRALAESPLLRADAPTAARVGALVDSIDRIDREREAHASLGGPGARYAALTARLTTLGQGLIRIAEQRLARLDVGNRDSGRAPSGDSSTLVSAPALPDSARKATADSLALLVAQEELRLAEARRGTAEYEARRAAFEERLNIEVPAFAMLVSALVVGVAFGYGTVFAREVRWPTVSDAAEVERITGAQVLVHSRATPVTRPPRAAGRERPFVPRIIDRDSDTFVLLHLALSGVGDATSDVDVVADDPVLAAGVAMGTAAAAARESRAVLVVESPTKHPLLAHLLRAAPEHSRDDVVAGRVKPEDALHVVTLDRDTHIDAMVAGSPPPHARRTARVVPAAVEIPDPKASDEALHRFEQRYDLRLYLTDPSSGAAAPVRDVVLCVRQGATPLTWLSRVSLHLRNRKQRVRAVVVWSRDVPTAS